MNGNGNQTRYPSSKENPEHTAKHSCVFLEVGSADKKKNAIKCEGHTIKAVLTIKCWVCDCLRSEFGP